MTSGGERPRPMVDTGHTNVFGRCDRCSMTVRRDEMDVHLAHAHNIGPSVKKEKSRDGRGNRRFAG